MVNNRRIKTSINWKPAIFALVGIILCSGLILYFSFSDDVLFMKLIFIVFLAIFDLAGLILLISQVFVSVEIKDEKMHSWVLFIHRQTPINKIKEVVYYDNGYTFYLAKNKKFATINSFDPLAGEIVRIVTSSGAKYKEKVDKKQKN